MKAIARIQSDFPDKFGIPRQSGLVESLKSRIVLESEYRNPDVFRGLEEFSHIWLIWKFSESERNTWSATVRPPRLGGNTRVGVFATRSPFRPNPMGLSCVRLDRMEQDDKLGSILYVSGADLMDGTPILDIKPYLPLTDSHPEAVAGFADKVADYSLEVIIPEQWLERVAAQYRQSLSEVLAQDPRPSYQKDPERIYGMTFAEMEVKFKVKDGLLTVCGVSESIQEGSTG